MSTSSLDTYDPMVVEGQEIVALLEIAIFDALQKVLNLFPKNDVLCVENNLMHERLGANCFVKVDVSELMKENADKKRSLGTRVFEEDSLTIRIFNKDKKLKSIVPGGDAVYVIQDNAESVLWFKNEAQEISFPIIRPSATGRTTFSVPDGEALTTEATFTSKDFGHVNRLVRDQEVVDLEIRKKTKAEADQPEHELEGFRLEDGRRYSLDLDPAFESQGEPAMLLRSYHFMPYPGKDHKVQVMKAGDEYVLHSKLDYMAMVDVDIYEYLSVV